MHLLLFLTFTSFLQAQTPAIPLPAAAFAVEGYKRLVLDASPEVQQALETYEAAGAAYKSTLAGASLPTLSFTALAVPYGHNPDNGYRLNRSEVKFNTTATWNLFNGFQDYQKTRAASSSKNAAEKNLRAARQSRAFAAISAFYDLNSKTQLLEVAQKNLEAQEKQYRSTQDLYRNGMRSLSDMLKGETDWSSSQLRLVRAAAEHKTALMLFNTLINRPAWGLAPLRADLAPGATELPKIAADLASALSQRPEVQKAKFDLERSKTLLQQAAQGIFPNLAVNAVWNRVDSATFGHASAASSIPNPNYQLGLNLSLPFNFNIVSQAQNYLAARADKKRAEAVLTAALRQVQQDVHSAYINLERSTLSYDISTQKEDIAQRNLKLVTDQFAQGSADSIRLAQAQTDYLDAQVERTLALNEIFINRALYLLAIGEPLW